MKTTPSFVAQQGFSLLEVMISVTIIAILASIAYPSYTAHVQKSRRSDAMITLQDVAQRQETYFIKNYSYATTLAQLNYPTDTAQGYYSLSLVSEPDDCDGTQSNACSGFTATATANDDQPQIHDSECASFSLNNRGTQSALNSDDEDSTNCWNG